jgi:hypothetical protein
MAANWRLGGVLVSLGAVILAVGLLLGPTPGEDPADALRDIAGFRTMYVITNMIDFAGILVMAAGLLAIARLQVATTAPLMGMLAGAASVSGGVLILLTLLIESTVEPDVAQRFVDAANQDQAAHLAAGQVIGDLGDAVFGLGFMLLMGGIAAMAIGLVRGDGRGINRWFLLAGITLAMLASPTGIAFLFDATRGFGRLEPFLGLAVLIWLTALGILLWRTRRLAHPLSG